jgi:hypothetical protein
MLRKSPVRTPALLAANRRNALKSTGPRTVGGRARVALNALKHGRYARHLGQRLLRAYDAEGAALYRDIRSAIFQFMVPCDLVQYREGERMAAEVWCHVSKIQNGRGTKPECPLESRPIPLRMGEAISNSGAVPARDSAGPRRLYGRVDIRSWAHGVGVTFWIQRRRFWTEQRVLKFLLGNNDVPHDLISDRLARRELENAVRWRIYRLARPTLEERLRFGLDLRGNHYPPLGRRFIRKVRREGHWPLPERPAR